MKIWTSFCLFWEKKTVVTESSHGGEWVLERERGRRRGESREREFGFSFFLFFLVKERFGLKRFYKDEYLLLILIIKNLRYVFFFLENYRSEEYFFDCWFVFDIYIEF